MNRVALTVEAERPEALEVRLGPGLWQPEGAEPRRAGERLRLPSGIYLEVPHRRRNQELGAIIEDHQPSRAHQLAQVEQVDKYVMKDVASADEGGAGDEAIGHQAGQGDL
jgi:hypothetical protein